jgi:ABC-type multidrug transport system fused ATPase/permease subunit
LRDNVLLFDGRADRWNPALRRAYDASALQTDIDGFAAGDETQIGELGVRVSGGQRQRIGLARAMQPSLDHRPGLLLLDDPFSAVDLATERHILMALREAFGPSAPPEHRATVVLCSHRLASFRVLDRVLVIDGGRIVESGDFEEMIAGGGTFARMYRAQAVLAESGSLGAVAR